MWLSEAPVLLREHHVSMRDAPTVGQNLRGCGACPCSLNPFDYCRVIPYISLWGNAVIPLQDNEVA